MSFLHRLFGKTVPGWARVLPHDEFETFLAVVTAALTPRTEEFRVDRKAGAVYLLVPWGSSKPEPLWLMDLAKTCGRCPPNQWPEIVNGYFDNFFAFGAEEAALRKLISDWEQVRGVLRVCLERENFLAGGAAHLIFQPIAPDLVAILVYGLPHSTMTVLPDTAAQWSVPLNDLIQTGLRNTHQEGLLQPERWTLGKDAWVERYEAPSAAYTASHALLLHEYYQPEPELGLLVSVPTQNILLVHPIRDAEAISSLHAMVRAVPDVYEQEPNSLSPHLYWSRGGIFTHLPFLRRASGAIDLYLPSTFQEQVLTRLRK